MRPPLAIARRVRITFPVRELVMLTMRGHPEERAPFHGRHAANRKKVLKPLGCRVGAMGEQPVITYPEPQAPRHPVQKDRDEQRMPSEEEKRRDCADVKQHQHRNDLPVQPILGGLMVPHAISLQDVCSGHSLGISYARPPGRSLFQIAHMHFLSEAATQRPPDMRIAELHPVALVKPEVS
jgi:hypothetical protein